MWKKVAEYRESQKTKNSMDREIEEYTTARRCQKKELVQESKRI